MQSVIEVVEGFCQTPLQLANPTQLQLVGEGVDFVFQRKKKKKKEEQAGAELCQAQDKLEVIVYIGVKVGFVSTKMFI